MYNLKKISTVIWGITGHFLHFDKIKKVFIDCLVSKGSQDSKQSLGQRWVMVGVVDYTSLLAC